MAMTSSEAALQIENATAGKTGEEKAAALRKLVKDTNDETLKRAAENVLKFSQKGENASLYREFVAARAKDKGKTVGQLSTEEMLEIKVEFDKQ
jgi:hypothetical protein